MMEQSSCLRSIERYSFALFVRNTRDRELLHPNLACTSGGGGTRNSICMCDNSNPGIVAVKVILVQVYNVVAAVFYVFGKGDISTYMDTWKNRYIQYNGNVLTTIYNPWV